MLHKGKGGKNTGNTLRRFRTSDEDLIGVEVKKDENGDYLPGDNTKQKEIFANETDRIKHGFCKDCFSHACWDNDHKYKVGKALCKGKGKKKEFQRKFASACC